MSWALRPDKHEIYQSMLFWDKIHLPEELFNSYSSDPVIIELEREGIIRKLETNAYKNPEFLGSDLDYHSNPHLITPFFSKLRMRLFEVLEQQEPGQWALARQINSPFLPDNETSIGRGLFVELTDKIPIPSGTVQLDDVLKFKGRRQAELIALRSHLSKLYQVLSDPNVDKMVYNNVVEQLNLELKSYERVFNETRIPRLLSGLGFSLGFNLAAAAKGVAVGAMAGSTIGATALGAILGTTNGVSITISKSLNRSTTTSPYEYVSKFQEELTWQRGN